jgi:uncharacterized protein GlcG (DUF336 family)
MSVLLVGHLKISAGGHLRPDCAKCRDGQHAIRNQVEEVQWLTWKKHSISSELAQKMVDKAVAKARELGVSENVAILDDGGNLKAFSRMDGPPILSIEMAQNKAYTALFGVPTQDFFNFIQRDPSLLAGIPTLARVVAWGGGFPIKVDGEIVGAIGLSGAPDIAEYTEPEHDPMIPHVIVLEPGLVIFKIYNGYWFFGRPTIEELRQDLRVVLRKCRPDWDITRAELRSAWEQGEHGGFYSYDKTFAQVFRDGGGF